MTCETPRDTEDVRGNGNPGPFSCCFVALDGYVEPFFGYMTFQVALKRLEGFEGFCKPFTL